MKKLVILSAFLSLFFILPTSAAEFNVNLKYGSKGADVIKLQEFLVEQDLYNGPVTGNFFSLTLKAVKSFQIREAISPASGFFGSLTRAKVNTLLDAQLADSESDSLADPAGPVIAEANPVSAEVLRLNEILGAVQSQTVVNNQQLAAIQEQNQILQGSLALQQAAAAAEAERLRVAEQARLDLEARNAAVLERSEQPGARTYTPEEIKSKYIGTGVGPNVLLFVSKSPLKQVWSDKQIYTGKPDGEVSTVIGWTFDISFSRSGSIEAWGDAIVVFNGKTVLDKNRAYFTDELTNLPAKQYSYLIVVPSQNQSDAVYEGTI